MILIFEKSKNSIFVGFDLCSVLLIANCFFFFSEMVRLIRVSLTKTKKKLIKKKKKKKY